eukprot:TCONS_00052364-protein
MSEETDLFLSHDWGEDGKTNHDRVKKINEAIKELGYITWFDNERMVGNMREQMAKGIDNTKCFIAFLTKRYHDKVVLGSDTDNCRTEFDYASSTVPMVAVVLDASMRNPGEWKGNIGLTLKKFMYIDMSGDIETPLTCLNNSNFLQIIWMSRVSSQIIKCKTLVLPRSRFPVQSKPWHQI